MSDSSDSEDNEFSIKKPQKKKTNRNSSANSSDIEEVSVNEAKANKNEETPQTSSNTSTDNLPPEPQENPFLKYGPDLNQIKAIASSPTKPRHSADRSTPAMYVHCLYVYKH